MSEMFIERFLRDSQKETEEQLVLLLKEHEDFRRTLRLLMKTYYKTTKFSNEKSINFTNKSLIRTVDRWAKIIHLLDEKYPDLFEGMMEI